MLNELSDEKNKWNGDGLQVDWLELIPHFLHSAQVIIIEAMFWIERPLSATELEKVAGGDPALGTFSYHLKRLVKLGALEAVGKCKTRKSQGSTKETFFYFKGQRQWIARIIVLCDSTDPITSIALKLAAEHS